MLLKISLTRVSLKLESYRMIVTFMKEYLNIHVTIIYTYTQVSTFAMAITEKWNSMSQSMERHRGILGGPIEPDGSVCWNSPASGRAFSRSAEER